MNRVLRDIVKFTLYLFLISSIGFLIYFGARDKTGVVRNDDPRFIERWVVIDSEGKEMTVGRSYVDDRAYNEDFYIVTTLPNDIKDNCFLCFPTRSDTIVYIDGEVRKEYIRSRDAKIPGGSVKGFYYTVPLKEEDSGAELKIFRGRTNRHPEIVPVTFVATMSGVYSYMFEEYGVTFFLALMMLILSAIVSIAALVMQLVFRRRIDLLYAALATFTTAAWIVTNSYLCPFVLGHYHIDGTLNYLACLMLPMGFLLYLDSIQQKRYTGCMTTLMVINTVSAFTWTGLHFTQVFPFDRALLYIDIILAVIMLTVFATLFIDLKRGHFSDYRYTAIGFLGIIVMGILEVIVLLFVETKHDSIPMLVGIAFFLICVILQQISDLLKINEDKKKALELSDAKTRFLAGMSHEIRTPINSILGMNEMIIRENKDKTIDEYAKSVRSSGKMLLTLVNDVLDFSKIEAGKMEITPIEYSLTRLITDVLPLVTERASAKGLKYKTIIEDGVPDGQYADEFRIKQIMINLLGNAIKYTDKGNVSMTVGGHYISEDTYSLDLIFTDTGRGIKEEDRAALFDAFTRADMKKNRNIEGTGLGLAIVKSIVDSMGGEISVSGEYGKGSVFSVTIPVKVTDKRPVSANLIEKDAETEEEHKCDYSAPHAKVLAVDDNRSNLAIVRLFLQAAVIKPDLSNNGKEAIEKCKETKYDLLLLDHMMPEPDGIETLKIVREDPDSKNKDTPAVILTANAMPGSRQMYLDAGFNEYLTKPLDSTLLEQTVKKYLPKDKIEPPVEGAASGRKRSVSGEVKSGESSASANESGEEQVSEIIRRLSAVEGLDVKVALMYSGRSEAVLANVVKSVVSECAERTERLREAAASGDLDTYRREAHTIKGHMATLGLSELSDRARRHEYAGRDGNSEFIAEDMNAFIREYNDVCEKIKE